MIRVVTEDPDEWTRANAQFLRQIPFAASKAVNELAKRFQEEQRKRMANVFTVRRKTFVDRSIKITHWAKKVSPFAEVSVQPPGGAYPGIIGDHEEPGHRTPTGRARAVPIDVRANKADVIRKRDRPRAFRFQAQSSSGAWEVYRGARRTFMIRRPDGSGWIFRRDSNPGSGRYSLFRGTTVLYVLGTKTDVPGDLGFRKTAELASQYYVEIFQLELTRALATARWGRGRRADAELIPTGVRE